MPRLFHVYPEGNFIEATDDTPYFQIGEHKYGKPIIDRVAQPAMRLGEAAKLALLSFDSTLRSNLSVGLPIDLVIYERDTSMYGARSASPRTTNTKTLRRERERPKTKAWGGGVPWGGEGQKPWGDGGGGGGGQQPPPPLKNKPAPDLPAHFAGKDWG